MTSLNKVVEMEYIFTINVNTTYIDANQNPVNNASTTGPILVDRNDQMVTLFDRELGRCIPPGLGLKTISVLIYNDEPLGFAILGDADMNMSVNQFIESITPSSRHPNRTNFIFLVTIAARPVAASASAV